MGDDACWLQHTCDCGAITEGPAQECWRCGEPLKRNQLSRDQWQQREDRVTTDD